MRSMVRTRRRSTSPRFLQRLLDALVADLAQGGIEAEADFQKVEGSDRYRVMVLSPQFEHVWVTERQELVWRIAHRALIPEERMRIGPILTLTPDELEGNC